MTRRSSRVWQKAMPNHPQRRRPRQRGCHSGPWSFLTNGSEPSNGLSLIILIGLFTNETLPELLEKSLETARLTDSGWVDVGYELGSSAGRGIDWLTFEDARASVVDDVRRIRQHPLVPKRIPIYGYIYNVRTGRLEEVKEATQVGAASAS